MQIEYQSRQQDFTILFMLVAMVMSCAIFFIMKKIVCQINIIVACLIGLLTCLFTVFLVIVTAFFLTLEFLPVNYFIFDIC